MISQDRIGIYDSIILYHGMHHRYNNEEKREKNIF